MEAESMKYIAVGCMSLGFFGAAIGIGNIFSALLAAISRNPSAESKLSGKAILGAGLTEALGLFALLIALILIFVVK